MPQAPITLGPEARIRILFEHAELRRQIGEGLALASAACAGDAESRRRLPATFERLFARVSANFSFEEDTLLSRLREALAAGWIPDLARMRRLLSEHNRLKERFAALCRRRPRLAPEAFAGAVKSYLQFVRRHLVAEEGWLLDQLPDPEPKRAAP